MLRHEVMLRARDRRLALIRLAFGSVQIMGASTGLPLLLQSGASIATGIVVTGTTVVTVISRLSFSSNRSAGRQPAAEPTKIKNT